MTALLVTLVAYLIGSLPFAVIASRLFGLADPRSYGSGNPGATNVLRSGNRKAAILTLIGDALKGAVAVLLARALDESLGMGETAAAIAGLAAFLGHVFSIFLRFKGGKGVATAAGVLLAMNPVVGALCLLVWLLIAWLTRYSSAAALAAALAAPALSAWLMAYPAWTASCVLMSAVLLWRHRENIARLLAGEESKLGKRRA